MPDCRLILPVPVCPRKVRQGAASRSIPAAIPSSARETGSHTSVQVRCGPCTLYDTISWHEDAIRPWQHRCWIFPRAPQFPAKRGHLPARCPLDLYARLWEGQPLEEDAFASSADEKTSIPARARIHPAEPTQPGTAMKTEQECKRRGAWACLAARVWSPSTGWSSRS